MLMNAEEVRSVVRRCGAVGIPTRMAHWYNAETERLYGPQLQAFRDEFPDDCVSVSMVEPGVWEAPAQVAGDYRWAISSKPANAVFRDNNWTIDGVIDYGQGVLPTWDRLDELLAHFQELDRVEAFAHIPAIIAQNPDRYFVGGLNHNFYDRTWKLHGVTNIMMDFHLNPDKVERLVSGILDLEIKWVRRYAALGLHAIGCADDYGCQRATLFSPAMFRRFFKPAYTALAAEAHRLGMDVWLHSCGNLRGILGDFAEAGIDMLHPIQVGCFDEQWVKETFTGRIGFHLGMDVQHLLVEAAPQEVERVCTERLALFASRQGGVAAAAGNAIMPETPMENIRAFHRAVSRFRKGGDLWAALI